MESNSISNRLYISGNKAADCTLLVSDFFNLFPSSFQRLVPMLEMRYRVISYTDNGFDIFNRTKQLRHKSIQGYANELIFLLQEQKVKKVTYVAHSVNALAALYAAYKEPSLFEKIVLLSALPCFQQDAKTQYQCGFDSSTGIDNLFKKIMQSEDTGVPADQFPHLLSKSLTQLNSEKARLIFDLLMAADCRNLLPRIISPVMILHGTGDKIATNEAAFFMHRHIPESFIVKIRAKGHLPQLQAPDEIYKAIEIFMHPIAC